MQMRIPDNLGTTLLAIWLIAQGVIPLLGLGSAGLAMLMSILAIAAGFFLLQRR